MYITPRKPTDQGGYLMMPLVKNIPQPRDPEWKRTTCPKCGRECWERPLPAEFDRSAFDGALCTECALKASWELEQMLKRHLPEITYNERCCGLRKGQKHEGNFI